LESHREYDWNKHTLNSLVKEKKKRNQKDLGFSVIFPTDQIRDERFETSEQISTFLLKNAQSIGLCFWQIF
jgi:hypothetical protein